jgi:hypothetical protein
MRATFTPKILWRSGEGNAALIEDDLRAAYKNTVKQARYAAVDAARPRSRRNLLAEGRGTPTIRLSRSDRIQGTPSQDRALEHPRHQVAY